MSPRLNIQFFLDALYLKFKINAKSTVVIRVQDGHAELRLI